LYVDGALLGSANQSGRIGFTGINHSIGASYNGVSGSEFFNGQIDEVRIWNIARTASDLAQYLNRSLTGAEPGLMAYYRFDEGAGPSAADSTVYGHNGVLINGPAWANSTAPLLPLSVTLISFIPGAGRQGSSVTITGSNLLAVTSVLFNGVSATFTINSYFSLTAVVPIAATTGPISLVTSFNTVASMNAFLVDNTAPSLSIIIPTNATFVSNLALLSAQASDNSAGSGISSVVFYIQRESDLAFWTGSSWGPPTPLLATPAGGFWSINSNLSEDSGLNDGAYTVYAVATDNAGNSTAVNLGLTVDQNSTVTPITPLANGHVLVRFPGIPGRIYHVQTSSNLSTWLDVGTLTEDNSGILQFDDADAPGFALRFYRTVTP
jgi:hypothetical protein